MWTFISVLGFLSWIVFGVMVIVYIVKKNGKRVIRSVVISGISFVVFLVFLFVSPSDSPEEMEDKRAQYQLELDESLEKLATVEAETAALEAEDKEAKIKQDRIDLIESQFSLWDGSHTKLKGIIKNAMNDPKSFEHDETTYIDNGEFITVHTKYRGKNGFGGVVRGSVVATFALDGELIEVLGKE